MSLFSGLAKTRDGLSRLFMRSELDDEFYEELEERLILADAGADTAMKLSADLQKTVREKRLKTAEEAREALVGRMAEMLSQNAQAAGDGLLPADGAMSIVMVIGVNGAGKTTSIGKMAAMWKAQGKKVHVAAADTFRAAASDQLETWTERAGVSLTRRDEGADPGAVLYDAIAAARAMKADILLVDTAGRLHTKKNLMDELGKLFRIITKELPDAHREIFLVLDGSTGLNARTQAQLFSEAAPITGLVLTKLDGTAKGGVVLAIADTMQVPVRFVGVGEGLTDLLPFDARAFAAALIE